MDGFKDTLEDWQKDGLLGIQIDTQIRRDRKSKQVIGQLYRWIDKYRWINSKVETRKIKLK